jgi:hypothetical protein
MKKYPAFPLPPLDRAGRRIRPGTRARIVGVPNLEGMIESERRTTEAVFLGGSLAVASEDGSMALECRPKPSVRRSRILEEIEYQSRISWGRHDQ